MCISICFILNFSGPTNWALKLLLLGVTICLLSRIVGWILSARAPISPGPGLQKLTRQSSLYFLEEEEMSGITLDSKIIVVTQVHLFNRLALPTSSSYRGKTRSRIHFTSSVQSITTMLLLSLGQIRHVDMRGLSISILGVLRPQTLTGLVTVCGYNLKLFQTKIAV